MRKARHIPSENPSDRRVTLIRASPAVRRFLKKRMPELALTPLLNALAHASGSELRAVRRGLDALEKLLDSAPTPGTRPPANSPPPP